MPNYWSFKEKGSTELAAPALMDALICAELNVPCDDKYFYAQWWDALGIAGSYDKARERADEELTKVIDYLEPRYDLDAWYSRGGLR